MNEDSELFDTAAFEVFMKWQKTNENLERAMDASMENPTRFMQIFAISTSWQYADLTNWLRYEGDATNRLYLLWDGLFYATALDADR